MVVKLRVTSGKFIEIYNEYYSLQVSVNNTRNKLME